MLTNESVYSEVGNYINIYIDADRTGTKESGIAIERGVKVAFDEVGNELAGHRVKILLRSHNGSSVRSKRHLREYVNDENALVVFSGLHSPPILENLEFIHENQILLLDPWAAAGPITRYSEIENWIFRLSIDDSKAGKVIVDSAIAEGFKRPFLLLEETGWGKSNYKTMNKALEEQDHRAIGVEWFNWHLGEISARMILRNIKSSGADVIFLVANAPEGKTFAKAMLSFDEEDLSLPIRSHWGITGGDFSKEIDSSMRKGLDLKFIQTSFSFNSSSSTALSTSVLERSMKLFPGEVEKPSDITAPTGFIHAYDLTKILIAAVEQVGLTGEIKKDRENVRLALESLKQPVYGLIKTYHTPFSIFTKLNPDAHEALEANDFVMGFYDDQNRILLHHKN